MIYTFALVCGGRLYNDWAEFYRGMKGVHALHRLTHVIHGGASGADAMADSWADRHGIQPVMCRALWSYWKNQGRPLAAGPIRNDMMLSLRPHVGVIFPGRDGTEDMYAKLLHFRESNPIELYDFRKGVP